MDAPGTPCSATEDKNARDQGTNAKEKEQPEIIARPLCTRSKHPQLGRCFLGTSALATISRGGNINKTKTQKRGTEQDREQFNIGYEAVRESDAELFR